MNLRRYLQYLALVVALPLSSQAQGLFKDNGSDLSKAHEAYASRDFKTLAIRLKQVLQQHPGDSVTKDNALALLEKAYESSQEMPVDWHLPDEIKNMRIASKRSLKDSAVYAFRVYGTTVHAHSIAQLQVIRYPDQVVLDKQAGIGGWSENSGIDQLSHVYELLGKNSREAVPSGLYLLNLILTDGTQTKGWFILGDDFNSTDSPKVASPAVDQVFTTGNPTFAWENFVSPQYKPFERRSLWVGVSRAEPPAYKWDEVWGHFDGPPTIEGVTVDSHGDESSVSELNPGRYVFFLDYHERRKFGDLDITRDSITFRNFRVVQQ